MNMKNRFMLCLHLKKNKGLPQQHEELQQLPWDVKIIFGNGMFYRK